MVTFSCYFPCLVNFHYMLDITRSIEFYSAYVQIDIQPYTEGTSVHISLELLYFFFFFFLCLAPSSVGLQHMNSSCLNLCLIWFLSLHFSTMAGCLLGPPCLCHSPVFNCKKEAWVMVELIAFVIFSQRSSCCSPCCSVG